MPFLRGLVALAVVVLAGTAAGSSPERSPHLARQALEARLDGPVGAEDSVLPRLQIRYDTREMRENLIGLLPGETLEDVARTLASRQVRLQLSSERAFVLVQVPLG